VLAEPKHALTVMQEPERIRMRVYRRKMYSLRQWAADGNLAAAVRKALSAAW